VTDLELKSELNTSIDCIVVGDESAITLHKMNYNIILAIVDFQTQRRKDEQLRADVKQIGEKVIQVTNPEGTITDDLWEAVEQGLNDPKPVRIEVSGEEDLAFIPCMLLAPENAVVIYGYPDKGLVLAWVTAENRRIVKDALDLMTKIEEV
jgi:uncharacterized protein (UPF0218 family)